jgi:hypothetical protein
MAYKLALDLEALRFLLSFKAIERENVLRFLEHLRSNPFANGDLTTRDATSREIQVSLCGRILVYHWTDHAVETVQIVRLELNIP